MIQKLQYKGIKRNKNNMTYLTEKVNAEACNAVLNLNMKSFFTYFPSRKENTKDDFNNGREYFKRVKYILDYLKRDNYSKNVKYEHSTFNPEAGRLFGKYSIQNLDGKLRRYLTCGVYYDYDMVNAHPNILRKLCSENDIQCPLLNNYCEDRTKFLEENDVSKTTILTLLNVDKPYNIKQYSNQVQRFLGELYEIKIKLYTIYKNCFNKKEETKNKISCLINIKLCDEENKILNEALDKIDRTKVGVLMFDGFMSEERFDPSILNTEFIKWSEKENTSEIEISNNYEPIEEEQKYEIIKKDWENPEKWYAHKILNPPCFMIDIGDDKGTAYNSNGLRQSFSHINYISLDKKGETITESFIDKWVNDDKAQIKYTICNIPHTLPTPVTKYNVWRKFDVIEWDRTEYEYDKSATDFFFNHIKEIICNNDDKMYQFVIKWIAHLFQKPHLKTGVCLITTGKQGTGKDSAIDYISAMMGKGKVFESTTPEKEIYGDFNSQIRDTLLVHISEINKGNVIGHMGKIKSMITSKSFQVKTKNVPNYVVDSLHNYWILSNNNDPIPVEKGQRRFVHTISNPKRKGDFKYFTKLHNFIKNKNALISIYEDLMKITDVPDIFTEKDLVFSSYQQILMEDADPYEEQFLKYFCKKNISTGFSKSERISNKDLYEYFCEFMIEKYGKCLVNKIRFGRLLQAIVSTYPDAIETGNSGGRYVKIDYLQLIEHLGDDFVKDDEKEIIDDFVKDDEGFIEDDEGFIENPDNIVNKDDIVF